MQSNSLNFIIDGNARDHTEYTKSVLRLIEPIL